MKNKLTSMITAILLCFACNNNTKQSQTTENINEQATDKEKKAQTIDEILDKYDQFGDEKHQRETLEALKPLAEQGNIEAQQYLGFIYIKLKDMDESLYWFTRVAESGDTDMQHQLAVQYSRGYINDPDDVNNFIRVELNDQKAIYWYTKVAESGDYHAKRELAERYEEGFAFGVDQQGHYIRREPNYEKALFWYKKASEQRPNVEFLHERIKKLEEKLK